MVKQVTPMEWIEALESGRYKQCRTYLREGNCFCALGVLLDIAGVEWCQESYKSNVYGIKDKYGTVIVGLPPDETYEAIGMLGFIADDGCPVDICVSNMNDNGDTFETIAKDLRGMLEPEP